jgi:hypothetical protein
LETTFHLPTLPDELHWRHQPMAWQIEADQNLSITAGAKTDLFFDPAGGLVITNAPAALFTPPDRDFILSAHVTVDFASAFDAGVLQLRGQEDVWAKLCFEYSPQRQPMIVSVVTRGFSDDCNSTIIAGNQVYLRLAHNGLTIAFHYSLDGRFWHLVRYFTLGQLEQIQLGFSAQSPTGAGCRALFSEITYKSGPLGDIRSGE